MKSHFSRRYFIYLILGHFGATHKGTFLKQIKNENNTTWLRSSYTPSSMSISDIDNGEICAWKSRVGDVVCHAAFLGFDIDLSEIEYRNKEAFKLGEVSSDDLEFLLSVQDNLRIVDCGIIIE